MNYVELHGEWKKAVKICVIKSTFSIMKKNQCKLPKTAGPIDDII